MTGAADAGSGGWSAPIADEGLARRDWQGAGAPPLSVWTRPGTSPRAIVLIGHGGSQHRQAEFVKALARDVLERIPAYVAAIDGPAHGDRLAGDADKTREAFIQCWISPDGGTTAMTADWKAALAAVRDLDGAADLPVGYYGVSMGTAYGVPFLATEPGIKAAAIGMWEAEVGGLPHLTAAAPKVLCPIHFVHREQDQFFSEAGARRLFDLLGSTDKTFVVLPGPHEETLDQLDAAAAFLVDHLTA